jgi:hypothetical protein
MSRGNLPVAQHLGAVAACYDLGPCRGVRQDDSRSLAMPARCACIAGWMRRLALLWLLLVLGAAASEQADVRVERFADPRPGSIGLRGEVRYSLTRADLTAILSYVPTSVSLTFRVQGRTTPTSLAEQGSLLKPLLGRFLQDYPNTPRITLLLTDHAAIVARLAAILGSCANWDGRTGRPVRGALGQFLVDTINRHDLVTEFTTVFADLGYRFAAQGASMISEARLPDADNRLVPTDIAYLSFFADLSLDTQRRAPWPTQFHHSTC